MSNTTLRKSLFTAASLVVALAFSRAALADGRDSLLHWWKVQDLNNDGLLQPGEFYDVMTRGATSPKTGSTVYQATEGVDPSQLVTVETVDVYKPSMRKTVSEPVLHLHNPTNWVDGVLKCNYQAVEADKACIGGKLVNNVKEGTVFIRFKWDGRRFKTNDNYNYSVLLYSDGYNTYSGWGWAIGFRTYDSGTANAMYPFFRWGSVGELGFNQNPHNSNFLIKKGYWYDMAVTFRRERIGETEYMTRAMMMRSGKTDDNGNRCYYYDKRSTTLGKNTWSEFDADGSRISLGYHSYSGASGGTTFVNATGSGDNSFIGSIHEVKEYTKYMEKYELLQTMVDNDPECMIGSKNGKANEFSDAQAEAVYEPATMDWIKMRRTLTAATPLAVKLELEENGHELGRLVEMKFLKEAAFAGERVKISLNGRQFGSKQIPADGELRFFISPSLLATVQKDADTGRYPVTLTLVRGDSLATSLSLDYFTVGGSWQLGVMDNDTKGFGVSGDYYNYYYNIGQRNISQVVGSIGNTGLYAPLNLYFGMTDWAAANLDFRLTAKSVNKLSYPATLTLNDGSVTPTVVSGVITTNIVFSAGQLKAGNRLNVSCTMTTGNTSWDSFDYWKLEALKPEGFRNSDEGLLFILK